MGMESFSQMCVLICRRAPETGRKKTGRDRCGCTKSDVKNQQAYTFWLESDSLVCYSVNMSASTDLNFQSKFVQLSKVSISNPLFIQSISIDL